MGNLTAQDLQILQAPFAANDHEFLQGKAYITEAAITRRIEAVDPAWTLEQVSLFNRSDDSTVVCTMRLTIKGTWRDGVGMSSVVKMKSGNGEANEAEKSAATDALKRAARLFGIGRYLLDLPDNVRDAQSMARYLSSAPKPPPSVGKSTPAPTTPAKPEKPATSQPDATTEVWKPDMPALFLALGNDAYASKFNSNERANTAKKINEEGGFANVATIGGAVALVNNRLKMHEQKREKTG